MSDRLVIRPAVLQDAAGVREIHSDGGDPWADPAECSLWLNHRLLRRWAIDVAVLDGLAVGHAEWQVSDEPEPYGRHLYLSLLEIHPEFRGRGIGRKMVEHRAAEAAAAGCRFVRTIPDDGAVGFYTRLGFTVSGEITRLCCSPRPAALPRGWSRCRTVPRRVVRELPFTFGWYQACSEFMWEQYEHPVRIAGDSRRHLRARRSQDDAFVDMGFSPDEASADPAAWAAASIATEEMVGAAFALAAATTADRICFAADSRYAERIAHSVGTYSSETSSVISRAVPG